MEAPPPLPAETPPPTPEATPVAAWRRVVMLLILVGYVLGIGLAGALAPEDEGPALPANTRALLMVCVTEVGIFAAVFAVAWLFGRTSPEQLFLRRWDGWKTLAWSVVWSVAVRLLAIPFMLVLIAVLTLIGMIRGTGSVELESIRPKFEKVIPVEGLNDPVYMLLMLTVLSFVVAGLREELWRAGVLAAFQSLLPERWKNWRGTAACVVFTALVFGAAHLAQGPGGVVGTFAVGLGLGALMVWRRTYWEAVLAHGLLDATTFVILWAYLKRDSITPHLKHFLDALKQMSGG